VAGADDVDELPQTLVQEKFIDELFLLHGVKWHSIQRQDTRLTRMNFCNENSVIFKVFSSRRLSFSTICLASTAGALPSLHNVLDRNRAKR
jgi:hypothetical protein